MRRRGTGLVGANTGKAGEVKECRVRRGELGCKRWGSIGCWCFRL